MSNIIKVRDNNGNWLGIPALKGVDGITPHIGENGNWFIGADDTGVAAGGLTELPIASADTLGAVKVGNNLTIDENGVLNGKDVDLTSYAQKSELPTKVSDLENDSLFIDNTVNNLTNYYTKTETYTQAEVNSLIGAITTLNIQVVTTLPTENISATTIYLKPIEEKENNNYEEWIYVNSNWELIGTTAVDLTNYATKEDLTNATKNLATKEYADNTKIYAQIYDLQHNTAVDNYKIKITKLANPYQMFGYASGIIHGIESQGILDVSTLSASLVDTSFVLTCGGYSETISFDATDPVITTDYDLYDLLVKKINAKFGHYVNLLDTLPIEVNVSNSVLAIYNPTNVYMPISVSHPHEGTSALDVLMLEDGANNYINLDQTLEQWFDNDYFITNSDITITINDSSFTFYKNTTIQETIDAINNDKTCGFVMAFDAAKRGFTLTAKEINLNTTCNINSMTTDGYSNEYWANTGLDSPSVTGAKNAEFYLIADDGTFYNAIQSETNEYLFGNRYKIILCDITDYEFKPVIPMYDIAHKCDQIQYISMPNANAATNNQIVQYIGDTTTDYKQGSFYKCVINPIRPIEIICEPATRTVSSLTCDNDTFKSMIDPNMTIGDSYVVKVSGTELTVTKNTETVVYTQTYESMTWEEVNTILNPIGIDIVPKRTGSISSNMTIVTIAINEGLPTFEWQEISFASESSADAITLETTEATYYGQLQQLFYDIYQNHTNGAKVPTIHMVFTDVATRSDFLTCLTIGNNTMTWETKSKIGVRATSSDSVLQHEIYNYVVTIGASATETIWEQKGYFEGIGTISRYLDTETNYTTPYEPIYDGSPATKKYVDDVTSNIQTQIDAKATKFNTTATIPSTGWTTEAPYYVDVTVTGMLASDTPSITVSYSGTLATDQVQKENWNKIDRIETYADKIRVYAFDEVPTTIIPIQIVVVR